MNREILFKAKRIDWRNLPKEQWWVEGDVQHTTSKNIILIVVDDYKAYPCDSSTLCQYTGLTDKNSKKIWENDILSRHLDDGYQENITYKKVIWGMNGFYTKENGLSDIDPLNKWDGEYFEVCGNIFDNPELLEVE